MLPIRGMAASPSRHSYTLPRASAVGFSACQKGPFVERLGVVQLTRLDPNPMSEYLKVRTVASEKGLAKHRLVS